MAVTNGWGQGVINNAIDWGKAAINNAISWGKVYLSSWYGDTEIYGYNAEALAYFTAYESAGGSYTENQKAAWNTFFSTGNEDGWSTNILAANAFQGSAVAPNLVNVINPGTLEPTNVNFVDGDVSGGSITGDGSTKYFNYSTPPSTYLANNHDWYYYAYAQDSGSASDNMIFGTFDGANVNYLRPYRLGTLRATGNGAALEISNSPALADGDSCAALRESTTSLKLLRNTTVAASSSTNDAANAAPTRNIFAFGFNLNGGGAAQLSDGSYYFLAFGEGMTEAKHASFDAAVKTLIASL